jgi:miniconductance mechanosensitive channel
MDWLTNDLLVKLGVTPAWAPVLAVWIATLATFCLAFLANALAKNLIARSIQLFTRKSKYRWDDSFAERKVFRKISHFASIIILSRFLQVIWTGHAEALVIIDTGIKIYITVVVVIVINSLLDAFLDIYRSFTWSKQVPIKSFLQVIKLVVYFVGGLYLVALVMGKQPTVIFGSLGALTAVLMLVFKDAILGFTAGIQLTTNRMLSIGDWLEMPKYGADGDVLEITLTTVKVQNWDKTITTIPTYALISDAFRNWRGMSESDGRRIKRSIHLDLNTIRFCDEEMLRRFVHIHHLQDYIERKKKDIDHHNRVQKVDDSSLVNGRRMTNIGTFRAYVVAYLRSHPMVNQEMTLLVRQLEPTPTGLPIQIYIFSKEKNWIPYEEIQSDLFDHFLAVLPAFDLRVFQSPSGMDVQQGLKAR